MNPEPPAKKPKMTWTTYALMTVFFWGVYGVILHMARAYMPGASPAAPSPEGAHAGLKAFLLVCGAYCATGIITLIALKLRGSDFSFTALGTRWGFIAGLAGALGAFTLVLALGQAASPLIKGGGGLGAAAAAAVMPIVFGCAPLVNTVTAMIKAPPPGGVKSLPLEFVIGCILAASGAFLVAKYAPSNTGTAGHGPAPAPAGASAPAPAKAPEAPAPSPAPAAPAPSAASTPALSVPEVPAVPVTPAPAPAAAAPDTPAVAPASTAPAPSTPATAPEPKP